MKPKDRRRLKKHIDMVMNSMDDINGIPENYRGHKDMANDELKPRPFCGGGEGMNETKKNQIELESLGEYEKLKSIVEDYRADTARVLNEKCPSDERHCGCVPILRRQLNNYQKALELIITLAKRALEEVEG